MMSIKLNEHDLIQEVVESTRPSDGECLSASFLNRKGFEKHVGNQNFLHSGIHYIGVLQSYVYSLLENKCEDVLET
jgi:hypothetical protein